MTARCARCFEEEGFCACEGPIPAAPARPSFSLDAGVAAREDGMARADRVSEDWKRLAHEAGRQTARALDELTADDVAERLELAGVGLPAEGRAFGPAMQRLIAAGVIEPTDRTTPSRRKSCHATPRRIYRSLLR